MAPDAFPSAYLDDIFTEPESSPDTLANLGPLTGLAGVWQGTRGRDVHPHDDGPESEDYVERWSFEPIDAQTNGPQLLYGLRYHTHIRKPGESGTEHDQVGYLLWEPATGRVTMTLAIPRAQVAMAGGAAAADATSFTLRATVGDPHFGIVTGPFLDAAFHTTAWEITFTVAGAHSLSYQQTTTIEVHGQGPMAHTDTNQLIRVEAPTPNPLAAGA
jgi:hypothetical protein